MNNYIEALAKDTYNAYKKFLSVLTKEKNQFLQILAENLTKNYDYILTENSKDIRNAQKKGLSNAFIDRLKLSAERIENIAKGVLKIIELDDPVGKFEDFKTHPEGFKLGKMRVPIGVIAMIYEARPNVTIDATALSIKSGNAIILRGGSNSYFSNMALVKIIKNSLKEAKLEPNLVNYIDKIDREYIYQLLKMDKYVHLAIPRGGEELIKSVVNESRIPVLKHYKGICHIYVNEYAKIDETIKICVNGKISRPAVCNATETILVDQNIADKIMPDLIDTLLKNNVEVRGCSRTQKYNNNIKKATDIDWATEYLDLIVSIKIVDNIDDAISHINEYSSGHTDSIITENLSIANKFIEQVDSATVMVNSSTRLSDGGVFGLGAEIGISTDRFHARGPMGLEELTTYKWVLIGDYNTR